MPKVLAVVPTYITDPGDVDVLMVLLRSIARTAPELEVLIVDDGSPAQALVDDIPARVDGLEIEVWREQQNAGFSSTVNVGLRRALAEGKDAVLINADIEFIDKGWLDVMLAQPRRDGTGPAEVVGALLLYPTGLIQHCSPGDEPILTSRDGYVPIAELAAGQQGLVSFSRRMDMIHRERRGKSGIGGHRGWPFRVSDRLYDGPLLAVQTPGGTARVTPNHKLSVYWEQRAFASHVVYLMRRGDDWRIGKTQFSVGGGTKGRGKVFGPGMRLRSQKGDALWILRFVDEFDEAWKWENFLSWKYGVPTWEFEMSGDGVTDLKRARLAELWQTIRGEYVAGIDELLRDCGVDGRWPLLERARGKSFPLIPGGRGYMVHAANLAPGYMRVPTDDGVLRPARQDFVVDEDRFTGQVYSLDVDPHEHYVSNGVVVHNSGILFSLQHRGFVERYKYAPHDLPEALHAERCPVTGALQLIRHKTLAEVGLYDENFKLGFEDVDMCIRVFEAGGDCIYQPKARAIHHESFFRGRPSPKIADWQARSWIYFCQKYAETSFSQWIPSFV